jgi:hypothetical protein
MASFRAALRIAVKLPRTSEFSRQHEAGRRNSNQSKNNLMKHDITIPTTSEQKQAYLVLLVDSRKKAVPGSVPAGLGRLKHGKQLWSLIEWLCWEILKGAI